MKVYDSLILGGGPAGLSASIYLARFLRSVLVLDRGHGRTSYSEHNENYLGFPQGIASQDLRKLGQSQAQNFGVKFAQDDIITGYKENDRFYLVGETDKYCSKTVVIATGVIDLFPTFGNMHDCIGKSLFWCITCDGYKAIDKKIIVVGHDDEAAQTSLQFLNFTSKIDFVTNKKTGLHQISNLWLKRLKEHNIAFYEGCISDISQKKGQINAVSLEDETILHSQMIFNQQGSVPNTQVAQALGVKLEDNGFIKTDTHQKTNVPFVYAAGDVTKLFAHQIVTAAHEGSMAAQAANYDLYHDYQKG